MKLPRSNRRTLALLTVIVPLLVLFVFVALRSGPLAPVAVTVVPVESRSIKPALYGVGTVEARYTYRIGPTVAGRLRSLEVHAGETVQAGQVLGEMDPVDLDERIRSLQSERRRAQARQDEAQARQAFALSQARRYEQLFTARLVSEEVVTTRRQELAVADAALAAARQDVSRTGSDREALEAQRANLRLVAPVDGVVITRHVDPGTTVVAGQPVVDVIDPRSLWVNVRFDQLNAAGLAAGLPARIVLRSRGERPLSGHVLRVEPVADAVTEEALAKVTFDEQPASLPPIGELAEVTIDLPELAASQVIPSAAVRRDGNALGVWRVRRGAAEFASVALGTADLDGNVQVTAGLEDGDQVVTYSAKALTARSRIHVVERIAGSPR
ncbi:MAG: efflux RND transporter periplasmic adaptor subunit [Steroidobacteraceae bacterium]